MKATICLALLFPCVLVVTGDTSLCPPIPSNLMCFSRSFIVFRMEGVFEISETTFRCKCAYTYKIVQLTCGASGEWIYENNIMCNDTAVLIKDNSNPSKINTKHPMIADSDKLPEASMKNQWNNQASRKVLMVGILCALNIIILFIGVVVTVILCVRRRNAAHYMSNLQSQVAYKRFFINKNEKNSAERCAIISDTV